MLKKILPLIAIACFIVAATAAIIAIGKGYRLNFSQRELQPTGILAATSDPRGAQVFVDNKLKTATNNTINLAPGAYEVKIAKEGFHPWQKTVVVKGEIVTSVDAALWPLTPSFRPITSTGALKPLLSPDGTKIVYSLPETEQNNLPLSANSIPKAGLWLIELANRGPSLFNKQTRQLTANSALIDWANAQIIFSPDQKQLLTLFLFTTNSPLSPSPSPSPPNLPNIKYPISNIESVFLLSTDSFNKAPTEVTSNYQEILNKWQTETELDLKQKLSQLKPELKNIAASSMQLISFSPDESKILYQASRSAQLSLIIDPPLIGANSSPEVRTITKDKIYVYDIKEDRNYVLDVRSTKCEAGKGSEKCDDLNSLNQNIPLQYPASHIPLLTSYFNYPKWYPTSNHLIIAEENAISIIDYDNTNKTTIYSGPFDESFVYPWPTGGSIIILTNLYSTSPTTNLYTINLR